VQRSASLRREQQPSARQLAAEVLPRKGHLDRLELAELFGELEGHRLEQRQLTAPSSLRRSEHLPAGDEAHLPLDAKHAAQEVEVVDGDAEDLVLAKRFPRREDWYAAVADGASRVVEAVQGYEFC
jgi:hypothetical protein